MLQNVENCKEAFGFLIIQNGCEWTHNTKMDFECFEFSHWKKNQSKKTPTATTKMPQKPGQFRGQKVKSNNIREKKSFR